MTAFKDVNSTITYLITRQPNHSVWHVIFKGTHQEASDEMYLRAESSPHREFMLTDWIMLQKLNYQDETQFSI